MNTLPFILLLFVIPVEDNDRMAERYLQQGIELEQQGNPQQALRLWQQAVVQLEVPSVAIAAEYVRLATQHELSDYYPSASFNYRWGMSGTDETAMTANRQALTEELERLEPLLEQREYRRWQTLLENNNPALFEEIIQFWSRLNLRPSTAYNERLIEHWLRIAYAREQFTRNAQPPYGTDARGLYYVKYGEPDYKESGRVDITHDKLQWILDQFRPPLPPGAEPRADNFDLMLLSNSISNLFLNPDYELWIYDSPQEQMSNNLILIFGHRSGGSFGRLDILEDFMPISAFNASVLTRSEYNPAIPPIPAGMALQMIYYEHFYSKDPYFAQLHNGLLGEFYRSSLNSWPEAHLAGNLRQKNVNQTSRLQRLAPDEFSTEEKVLADIPMQVYQYRMLNEFNRPVFVTFQESYPFQAFLDDFVNNEDAMSTMLDDANENETDPVFDWYRLTHGLQLRNEKWELLGHTQQSPSLVLDIDGKIPSSSVFRIPWNDALFTQVFYTELMNNHPASKPRSESLFDNSLRGLGKLEIVQPEPLSVIDGQLLAGDLILGYRKMDHLTEENPLLNFIPAHNLQIPEGENLVIYFEVYLLQKDSDGISRFEVDYEIRPVGRLFGWTREKADQNSITVSFEHYSDRFSESLEIETVGLETGRYVLDWVIHDIQSGQKHKQQVRFEVVENSEITER